MEIKHCLFIMFCLEYAAGHMLITSNVTTVSVVETYSINCSTIYQTIAFYKNGANFTTTWRDAVNEPCKTTTKITCSISKLHSYYYHVIFVKVDDQDEGNITWQCKHISDQKTKSRKIFVKIDKEIAATSEDRKEENSDNMVLYIVVAVVGSSLVLVIILIAAYFVVKKRKQPNHCIEDDNGEVIVDENVMYGCAQPAKKISTDYDTLDDNLVIRSNETAQKEDDDCSNMYTEVKKETKPKVQEKETNDSEFNVYAEVNKRHKN